jgi:hypothetical protein
LHQWRKLGFPQKVESFLFGILNKIPYIHVLGSIIPEYKSTKINPLYHCESAHNLDTTGLVAMLQQLALGSVQQNYADL